MIYEILQSAQQPLDRYTFSLPISTFSALGVSHAMRYINARYLLTYLQRSYSIRWARLVYGLVTVFGG